MADTAIKWYKTTGGKIGIVVIVAAIGTAIAFAIKHFTQPKQEQENDEQLETEVTKTVTEAPKTATPPVSSNAAPPPPTGSGYTASQLPNGGDSCDDVKTTFDKTYNYVKCNGIWWTISKDAVNGIIKQWKSLAANKTATDLLNNKYA